ncbi:phosphate ABC transporter substrate-binding protein PstS [Egicoccus halophilus]|uniref:Phosphate-binding protein n=1 Tax=Egicoccus halophilus TaxID=1670830 RepID=A0A8J3AAV8_9ACTN|nr:phosphate ABC transporter substrate-binding protein PstS [Egicoccus halophilus]GGI08963.1 phosphate-binding protein [Egicoccus halophilus]
MRVRAHSRTLAAVAAFSLAAAACGGGDDLDSAPSAEEAEQQADDDPEATTDATDDVAGDDAASDDAAGEGISADLLGAGASFPNPLYQTWIGEFQGVEPGVSLQYESIGSSGGREQFISQQVAFAGTDAAMGDEEQDEALEARQCEADEVLHIPTVFGGVVIAYNIDGLDDLVLDGETIADIFAGEITNINDPAIAELNEGVELPDQELTVAVRADGSGTTSIFTTYLDDESSSWSEAYGAGSEIEWFDGVVAGEQNDGVANAIVSQPGGIGYLSLEYAVAAGLDVADVINADGNAVEPTTETVSAAADGIELPDDLRFNILGVGGEGYPIAGATWILAWTCGYEQADAEALQAFLTWTLEEGDQDASDLGYAPLAESAQQLALEKVERINEEG